MPSPSQRDLEKHIIKVDTKLNILITQMNRVIYEPGTVRCESRRLQMNAIDRDMGRLKKAMAALWVTVVGLLFADSQVAAVLTGFFR